MCERSVTLRTELTIADTLSHGWEYHVRPETSFGASLRAAASVPRNGGVRAPATTL